MNTSDDRTKPKYVRQSDLLWTQRHPSHSNLKRCCFCISDWLLYLIGGISISIAAIIYLSIILAKPPVQFVQNRLSPHFFHKHAAYKSLSEKTQNY